MELLVALVIVVLLVLLYIAWYKPDMSAWSNKIPMIKVMVTPTAPAAAVAKPADGTTVTPPATAVATSSTPSDAAAAAVKECMTSNKWKKRY
jgi:hypothetical protein